MLRVKASSRCFPQLSLVSVMQSANFSEADALARKFHETHDMAVKDELERLLKEYGNVEKPWRFVAS